MINNFLVATMWAWYHAVEAFFLVSFNFLFWCRHFTICVLAWKAQVHGIYELLSQQGADPLVPWQYVNTCPAAWTFVGIVFVCAHLTDEVTILALCDGPFPWNLETNNTLQGLLNLPLKLGFCFLNGLVTGFFADPFYLWFGQIWFLSWCHFIEFLFLPDDHCYRFGC